MSRLRGLLERSKHTGEVLTIAYGGGSRPGQARPLVVEECAEDLFLARTPEFDPPKNYRICRVHWAESSFGRRIYPEAAWAPPGLTLNPVFRDPPLSWGLRGDPYMWAYLEDRLADGPPPPTCRDFMAMVTAAMERVLGMSVDADEYVYVKEFAHGGMSSGQVCLEHWRKVVFPLLENRYEDLRRSACARDI